MENGGLAKDEVSAALAMSQAPDTDTSAHNQVDQKIFREMFLKRSTDKVVQGASVYDYFSDDEGDAASGVAPKQKKRKKRSKKKKKKKSKKGKKRHRRKDSESASSSSGNDDANAPEPAVPTLDMEAAEMVYFFVFNFSALPFADCTGHRRWCDCYPKPKECAMS